MIEIKNLNLTFPDGSKVFQHVNINIHEEKITLISGASGCGKSSLLLSLAGAIPESVEGKLEGEICYKGKNIVEEGTPGIAGEIGYIFQDADSQLCTFTVEDEIAFGLENIRTPREEINKKIDYYLELVHIKHLRHRRLTHLSGGEKQKLAVAAVLAIEPKIILMDEPTANLDEKSTLEMATLIKELKEKHHKTIVLVEHKLSFFEEMIDQVIYFDQGEVKALEKDLFFDKMLPKKEYPSVGEIKGSDLVLSVDQVGFKYPAGEEVLKEISFQLKAGEILALIGKNGAGKSTLTKVLMGLYKPSTGHIYLCGDEISNKSPRELGERMGLVFQNPEHQFLKMEVESELGLSLKVRGCQDDVIQAEVNRYLDLFNLEHVRHNNPFMLSQGQKRRLSTAAMMINGQKVLILDEPTYGQDYENLYQLMVLLTEINRTGVSILMITHDMDLVQACCHRAIEMEAGKIKREILQRELADGKY